MMNLLSKQETSDFGKTRELVAVGIRCKREDVVESDVREFCYCYCFWILRLPAAVSYRPAKAVCVVGGVAAECR